MRAAFVIALALSCTPRGIEQPFPVRAPLTVDTDMQPVATIPRPYVSPFLWDAVDNAWFAPLSRTLSISISGEAANATSLDEVADSSWFQRRPHVSPQQLALGACSNDDVLPAEVADGTWVIDRGKHNGGTHGFRVAVPGKGLYMLKADDDARRQPERGSAASVIGAAIYHAAGFNTTCEQIVWIRRAQLKLKPGLSTADNAGVEQPFDAAALDKVLAGSTQVGDRTRMVASKWLPGVALGPFRYVGTRDDDANDIIAHEDRRELRGSRLLAAWIAHWDAREQNSMDVWIARDAAHVRSTPGYVRHYMLDMSDALGGDLKTAALNVRLNHAYVASIGDVVGDLVTFGISDPDWRRARPTPGRERFGLYSERGFEPETWVPVYPNPAMLRMTERDGAWMARIIAHFTEDDLVAIVAAAHFADPADASYVVRTLRLRQRAILARYFAKLSPLGDVHTVRDAICATDFARSSGIAKHVRYRAFERTTKRELPVEAADDGSVCVRPQSRDRVAIAITNGTSAGPLVIHAVGTFVIGVTR